MFKIKPSNKLENKRLSDKLL